METKLRELQEKLAVEEADKIQLQNKLHQSLESEVKIYFSNLITISTSVYAKNCQKMPKVNFLINYYTGSDVKIF